MNHPADNQAARQSYYSKIESAHMSPLWESLSALVPESPRSPCVPHLWCYDQIRPWLMESGSLITAREAVRRVLILENPGLPKSSAITQSLYAGLQLILPGEVAPSHRHTQTALRLIVEGEGAYTAVDGERATMHVGDFIITPAWTWHDHGNPAQAPVVWLDGLDIPLVRFFDVSFAETYPEESQPVSRREGDSFAQFGSNLLPINFKPSHSASPVFSYPYARSREVLASMARANAPDPSNGYKMEFINPTTGGSAMPTMAAFIQFLPKGFSGNRYRSTDGTVFHAIEGSGTCVVGDTALQFGARDTWVVPSWQTYRVEVQSDTTLFSFSDRPVQQAMQLWREQRWT